MDEDFYTAGQAAKILGVTERGVRLYRGRHRTPQREIHRLLQERR